MRNVLTGLNIDGDARAACSCNRSRNQSASKCSCDQQPPQQPPYRPYDGGCYSPEPPQPCRDACPAMVSPMPQDSLNAYEPRRALVRGSLFPCLDKPMCSERCTDNPCVTCAQADQFTAWEWQLYLDTHPGDQQALSALRKHLRQAETCHCPATADCARWAWPDGPWPWEYQCCGKEA